MTDTESALVQLCKSILSKMDELSKGDIIGGDLLTRDDLTRKLGVTRTTLMHQIKAGSFPGPLMIAGQHRWSAHIINDFIIQANTGLLIDGSKR